MQEASSSSNLPLVRRLEAVGFRAWPAATVIYDGSWQIRLSGGHPSKRLNCVVPLDPSDIRDMDLRLEKARKRFQSYGRPLLVRQTPLSPPRLMDRLTEQGWERFETVKVMMADLGRPALPDTIDHLPTHDIGRFVDANLLVRGEDPGLKPALAEVLSAIKPTTGLFVIEKPKHGPAAVALCVQDNDLAGVMELAVAESTRRQGLGTEILASALRWARINGARSTWLQVLGTNAPALALYGKFGFQPVYEYHYWREAD
ncbi:MAG TPA: GNAT family N-acetyltransferase [Pseudorhizobium sp.]|jgi:GNAT superfamily N-acetyltransferase|nr:GNAT family N-acetyltransferase [Pseudorhizobium sp.]